MPRPLAYSRPTSPRKELANAHVILENARDTAEAFLHLFEMLRKGKAGASTDEEQDVLRAMFVFATAGLDAIAKQLVRDALPTVLTRHSGTRINFAIFAERQLRDRLEARDYSQLARVLVSELPARMEWSAHGSMTSRREACSQSRRFRGFQRSSTIDFKKQILPQKVTVDDMRRAFRARNEIVHEMDSEFSKTRTRRQRSRTEMEDFTKTFLEASLRFLKEVEGLLT